MSKHPRRPFRPPYRSARLVVPVLLLVLAGCGGSRRALVEAQRATIDSLRTAVATLHTERDSLRTALAGARGRVDTLTVVVRQATAQSDSAFVLRDDSLRHRHVLQFLRGQEQAGQLRGETLEVIYFGPGGTTPLPGSLDRLGRLAARLERLPPGSRILVEGHTDDTPFSSESPQNNRVLSADRAEVVRKHLVERSGLAADRFEAAGFGADMPLFPNEDAVTRRFNRRVRIAVLEP